MKSDELTRRALLQAIAAAVGVAALPVNWLEIVEAADQAHAHAATITFLTAAEAADVEAVAAQIIPTDDTPGAREAGVIHFIDRVLATFLARLAPDYRTQLAEFQAACHAKHPEAASFAALPSDQQIAFLKTVDHTPFFETTRMLTLFGMFTDPKYGGNRDGVGWKLIGFEDRHMFQPPFGYYDRDYPGFLAERSSTAPPSDYAAPATPVPAEFTAEAGPTK
jgi:hypothetical protein